MTFCFNFNSLKLTKGLRTLFVPFLKFAKLQLWNNKWLRSQFRFNCFFPCCHGLPCLTTYFLLGISHFNEDTPKILCSYVRSIKERIDDH